MTEWDIVVALAYGQFYLTSNAVGRDASFDVMPTLNRALDGDGIGAQDGFLVILSPHGNNSAMRLRIEVHEDEPPDDLDDWEEAFEAWLRVDETGLVYESPTLMAAPSVPVPPGEYCVRITGRGFIARGWTPVEPDDEWRVRLWPGDGPRDPRRLKQWQPPPAPAIAPPARVERTGPSPGIASRGVPRGIRQVTPPQDIIDVLDSGRFPPPESADRQRRTNPGTRSSSGSTSKTCSPVR